MGQPSGSTVEQSALSSSGGNPPIDPDDWRSQLPLDSRHRIVNKIMETLKKHLPFSGQEGLQELKKIAVRFEEKIYSVATSQYDYLRKISLKVLTMETKSPSPTSNSVQTFAANASRNSSDLASNSMQSQIPNQALAMSIVGGQSQGRQQLLSQNMLNNNSTSLKSEKKGRKRIHSSIGYMDGNNWKGGGRLPMGQPSGSAVEQSALSSSGGAPPIVPDDWRSQLPLDSRHRIVNKIMETLKKHLPFSGQEGLQELKKIAVRFEEKIYSAATSQYDYLRKISLKMLTMETKSQSPTPNFLQTNAANASRNSSDLASNSMQSQIPNQALAMPIVGGQSQGRHQLLSQNMLNNNSTSLKTEKKGRKRIQSSIGYMDGNNWSGGGQVPMGQPSGSAVKQSALSSSGGVPPIDPDDWRSQLPLDSRYRIVNKILNP